MLSRLALAVLIICAMALPARAVETMSPADAWAEMQAGRMVLVDVRQPQEWKSTGIAPGAVPLAMRDPAFLDKLIALRDANPGKALGLICAAGGRSTFVALEMSKRGLGEAVDIDAGMLGTWRKTGWIKSGLPVTPWTGP